ncbi:MAG: SMC-Scp complex subunit ScpB [Alphaproteobacteria bacterium]|nr:SMC-Scp complex subunit ScpB [Alphaproteobacteria bacterium]
MNKPELVRLIEALLFASEEPLSTQDLHARIDDADADVGGALLELQAFYQGRGIELNNFDGKWVFRTAADLGEHLNLERHVQRKLSRAALETLAIVSYHQPVTRAEIENIRGVATHRGTLDALIEAGWVKPGRRRQTPGRPLTWVTTSAFLDQFNLESIMDLPGMDDLKAAGLLDRRPAIEAIPSSGELFEDEEELEDDDTSEYEEDVLDEEFADEAEPEKELEEL